MKYSYVDSTGDTNLTNVKAVNQKTAKIVVLKGKRIRPAVRKYPQTELRKSEERAFLFFMLLGDATTSQQSFTMLAQF